MFLSPSNVWPGNRFWLNPHLSAYQVPGSGGKQATMLLGFLLNLCGFSMLSDPITVYVSSHLTLPPFKGTSLCKPSACPELTQPFSVDGFSSYFIETTESNTRELPRLLTTKPSKLHLFVMYSQLSLLWPQLSYPCSCLRPPCLLVVGSCPLFSLYPSLSMILSHSVSPPALRMGTCC